MAESEKGGAAGAERSAMERTGAVETGERIDGRRVLGIAAPIVVSNATLPLQGAVDTAMIGSLAIVSAQAAVGLGGEIFTLLLGAFNFLQIGVSGLAAQALGARDGTRVVDTLVRGLLTGLAIALALMALQAPLAFGALAIFEASAEAETLARAYFDIRIWGAPAELMNYALLGWFAGQAATRILFVHQIAITAMNIGLNALFVLGLGWGVEGVALGTAIAAYGGLAVGFAFAARRIRVAAPGGWSWSAPRVLERAALRRMMALNADVFVRTLLLIFAFTWLARLGSLQGDAVLAANVVLMQLFLISAHGLDGFAIAAETLVGQAAGRRDRAGFDAATRATMVWSLGLAMLISIGFWAFGTPIVHVFSAAEDVRAVAFEHYAWAAFIPLAGAAAFIFDGVFVGATASREMRNGMIVATGAYLPLSVALLEAMGNHGVWLALWLWLILRAAILAAWYPRVRRRLTTAPDGSGAGSV